MSDAVLLDPDVWSRTTPFGARLRDVVTDRFVADGLRLRAYPNADLRRRPIDAKVNHGGVYLLQDLPGLRAAESSDGSDADWAAVTTLPFLLVFDDPAARYLPFSLSPALPVRGLFGVDDGSSPPRPAPDIPLYSSPTRPPPDACAVIRAELHEAASGAPAAWALVRASIAGTVVATGIADALGRLALFFAFPEPPRPPLTSPPPAVAEPVWPVDLQAFYLRPDPVPEIPDLATVLAQVAHPCRLLDTLSPPVELPAQTVAYHRETTVRSMASSTPPSPYLFIEAA